MTGEVPVSARRMCPCIPHVQAVADIAEQRFAALPTGYDRQDRRAQRVRSARHGRQGSAEVSRSSHDFHPGMASVWRQARQIARFSTSDAPFGRRHFGVSHVFDVRGHRPRRRPFREFVPRIHSIQTHGVARGECGAGHGFMQRLNTLTMTKVRSMTRFLDKLRRHWRHFTAQAESSENVSNRSHGQEESVRKSTVRTSTTRRFQLPWASIAATPVQGLRIAVRSRDKTHTENRCKLVFKTHV